MTNSETVSNSDACVVPFRIMQQLVNRRALKDDTARYVVQKTLFSSQKYTNVKKKYSKKNPRDTEREQRVSSEISR